MKYPDKDSIDAGRAPDVGEPVFLEAPPPRPRRAAKSRGNFQGGFLGLLRALARGHRMERCL